ncbi:MAG: polyisoprenoid-binding protein [Phycisphaera sp.]|nr:polyisoprenoid-binding protein [Phycisphaera sp.]
MRKTIASASILALATCALVGFRAPVQTAATPAPAASAAEAATYGIDNVHSHAMFRVHHLGAGQFWGRFNDISGSMSFDAAGAPTAFDISVAVESVDTAEPRLDNHLKSPDFFNAKEFPALTFKSTKVSRNADGNFVAVGDFSMHGVTREISAAIEVTGLADMGMGARAGVEAIFTVKRSDFGMKYGLDKGTLGDSVRVTVALEGVKK